MQDEIVVADSAGHTMIDIEAVRAADSLASGDAKPDENEGEAPEMCAPSGTSAPN